MCNVDRYVSPIPVSSYACAGTLALVQELWQDFENKERMFYGKSCFDHTESHIL